MFGGWLRHVQSMTEACSEHDRGMRGRWLGGVWKTVRVCSEGSQGA